MSRRAFAAAILVVLFTACSSGGGGPTPPDDNDPGDTGGDGDTGGGDTGGGDTGGGDTGGGDGGPGWTGNVPTLGWCAASGFCWANPLPQGHPVQAVWGSADDDVWAVGADGLVLHWDGAAWSLVDAGTDELLVAVEGRGPDDVTVLAVTGELVRWDGARWTRMPGSGYWSTIGYRDLWLAGDVLFAADGNLSRWNVDRWYSGLLSVEQNGSITEVAGASAADGWALGSQVFRFDGELWRDVPGTALASTHVASVSAAAVDDVFAGSYDGLYRFDGAAWAQVAPGSTYPVHAAGGGQAWVIQQNHSGYLSSYAPARWDGASYVDAGPAVSRQLTSLWVGGSSGWAFGDHGLYERWDGTKWSTDWRGFTDDMEAAWMITPADVWVGGWTGGASTVRHWNGSSWAEARPDPYAAPRGIFARGPAAVYLATTGGVFRWNGWRFDLLGASTAWTHDVWAGSATDVWATSYGQRIRHWDGTAWQVHTLPTLDTRHGFLGIWGTGSDDVWAAGTALNHLARPDGTTGLLAHWDGATWSVETTAARVVDVWGSAKDDYWAVGSSGTILHYDGASWMPVESGTTRDLRAVWGSAADDVWAVGDFGTIVHWDGATWSPVASNTRRALEAVHGANGAVVTTGGSAVIYRAPSP
jgi:hypothetical protein